MSGGDPSEPRSARWAQLAQDPGHHARRHRAADSRARARREQPVPRLHHAWHWPPERAVAVLAAQAGRPGPAAPASRRPDQPGRDQPVADPGASAGAQHPRFARRHRGWGRDRHPLYQRMSHGQETTTPDSYPDWGRLRHGPRLPAGSGPAVQLLPLCLLSHPDSRRSRRLRLQRRRRRSRRVLRPHQRMLDTTRVLTPAVPASVDHRLRRGQLVHHGADGHGLRGDAVVRGPGPPRPSHEARPARPERTDSPSACSPRTTPPSARRVPRARAPALDLSRPTASDRQYVCEAYEVHTRQREPEKAPPACVFAAARDREGSGRPANTAPNRRDGVAPQATARRPPWPGRWGAPRLLGRQRRAWTIPLVGRPARRRGHARRGSWRGRRVVQFVLVADLAVGLVVGLGGVGERRAIRRRPLGTASPAALSSPGR